MIQIRNVPEKLHRTLRVRAAQAGLSLSDYLLGELRHVAEHPTVDELWQRIEARGRVETAESAAEAVLAEREAHEGERERGEAARGRMANGERRGKSG
jgi:plasmid stability protein